MESRELLELLETRRSIRRFRDQDVTDEQVILLLRAAIAAPSAGNAQPWRFIVVRNPELKADLARAALGQTFVARAPVVVAVCADLDRALFAYGPRGRDLYCIQDTAAAIQNLLLMAHALGLGACWVGAFDERAVAEVLDLPPGLRPVALLPVGHPGERPASRGRRPLEEVTEYRP